MRTLRPAVVLIWGLAAAQWTAAVSLAQYPPSNPTIPASYPGGYNPGPPPGFNPPGTGPSFGPPPADPNAINNKLNPQGPPPDGKPQAQGQLIVDVQILGVAETREHTVQKYLHARKDREFDPEIVQSDVRRLVSSGLFRDVRTYTKPAPGGVVVIYEIFERPRIRYIKHIGNRRISEKKLAKEHGLKVNDPLNAYSAEEGRRKIEELHHKQGMPKAQVTIMEGDKPNDQGLVYYINEGNLERIEGVSFRGNTVASDARLKTQIESKPGYFYYFFGGKVDRQKLDSDVEKLTAYYRRLGYFRARVARELDLDESGSWVTLTFVIDEGPRYTVRSVKIEGTKHFPQEPLLGFMDIKPGEYFDQDKMNKDVTTLTDLYGSKGYVFADVQADPRFLEEPGQLDLVYRVQEGEVFYVGDINVHIGGEYPHTRDSVVMNRMGIRPGDLADMREIKNAERRLKAAQLFETNPQQGEAPKVVLGTPSVGSTGTIAKRGSPTIRGQSPEYGPPHRATSPAIQPQTTPYSMDSRPAQFSPPYSQPQLIQQPAATTNSAPAPYSQYPAANRR